MTETTLLEILNKHNQQHIADNYLNLSSDKQKQFLEGLQGVNLDLVFKIHENFAHKKELPVHSNKIKPAPVISIPKTKEEKAQKKEAKQLGESLIRKHETAVLIVAGGQGSRLGFDGPKGVFPLSPIKKKTLFQLFCESIKASSVRYDTEIPLLIMTSHENHHDTVNFFNKHGFFGLHQEQVHFFQQGRLPSITPQGKLILKNETGIFENPDGHGGSLKALHDSGFLTRLLNKGVAELFYCQIDNPLATVVDPLFLGYHRMENAEISTKAVRRKNIDEKVGVCVSVDDKSAIIEYSDMKAEDMNALDENGNILYWAGNTAIHVLNLGFIKRLNYHGFALPYHRAVKHIDTIAQDKKKVKVTGWKFETFVFDAIPFAQKACFMEVLREEEFSPVKNKEGVDSPQTASADMVKLHRGWLEDAGISVQHGTKVEISPMFALDKEELSAKLDGSISEIKDDTYFG
jgi:UDP-N-acetylglucosamine/UDP-N-acetylgalactosamine diphosphorylase